MGWQTTLTAAVTSVGGPFPPNYLAGANGFVAAASNPAGDSAGALSLALYYGAPIVAIANDAGAPSPTQVIVCLEGSYDQTFLGTVTTPDGKTYAASAATWTQALIGANTITQWIWPLAAGGSAIGTGTVSIGNTGDQLIALAGEAPSSTQIVLVWSNTFAGSPTNYDLYRAVASSNPSLYQTLGGTTFEYTDSGLTASQQYTYYVVATYSDGSSTQSNTEVLFTPASGISAMFNCNCEPIPILPTARTLSDLRASVARRLGYAAVATNLPPGMAPLLNEFLQDAQRQLYRQHDEFHTKRFYAWQMEINQRYYGITQDESGCRSLDPLGVEWVGFEDLNQAWYTLISGINPLLYTRAQISTGWPTHYEIRSCIEIFPAPKAQYTLWIKGHFGLDPFVADTDYTTIDSEAVFLLALGLAKAHYGQADAQAVLTQADNYTKYLVAKQHGSRRYVPRTHVKTLATPPLFLPTLPGGGPA